MGEILLSKSLFLIGFMGAGKSSVGAALASMTGVDLVDLDGLIVQRVGLSIPEIFSRHGEAAFRQYETEALQSLTEGSPRIVATGGGVVGRAENWTCMRQRGQVVYLRAEWEILVGRIGSGEGRPLAQGADGDRLRQLWQGRLPLYEQADLVVDANLAGPEEVARRILKAVVARRTEG